MDGFTDEQLENLSEEERAALEEEEEGEESPRSNEGEAGEAEEPEEDGEETDQSGTGAADGEKEGDDNDDDQREEDQKEEPSAPPVDPIFKLNPGADGKTIEELSAELNKLDEQFEEGDISLKDYNAQRDALNQAKFRLEMYEDINRQVAVQTVENNWKAAQREFYSENRDYIENSILNAAYVHAVNSLLATDEGKAMSDRQVLLKAKEAVEESLGMKKGEGGKDDQGDAGKAALAAAKKKEAGKGRDGISLRDMPKSQEDESGDRFDALDRLEGEAFEVAIGKLSDSEREAYARRG